MRIGLGSGVAAPQCLTRASGPAALIADSGAGLLLAATRATGLYSDTAGLTPVMAPGTAVARLESQASRTVVLTQSTPANRPLWGRYPVTGIRNLLVQSETFTGDRWQQIDNSLSLDGTLAPDGVSAAHLLTKTGTDATTPAQWIAHGASDYAMSVHVKAATSSFLRLRSDDTQTVCSSYFNLASGTITATSGCTAQITALGGGWWRCTLIRAALGDANFAFSPLASDQGPGGGSIYVWGAQVDRGTTPGAYQRVVSRSDVFEAGHPRCAGLYFDGTGPCLTAAGENWLNSPAATVIAHLSPLGRETRGMAFEFGDSSDSAPGHLGVFAPAADTPLTTGVQAHGATGVGTLQQARGMGACRVAASVDLGTNTLRLRNNGGTMETGTPALGGGTFSTQSLSLGARANGSEGFCGVIFGLFAINRLLSDTEIARVERWFQQRSLG